MALEQPRIPPQLGRSPVVQLTAEAFSSVAQLAAMAPQDMGWADKPMLVGKIDLYRAIAVAEKSRASNERDIVEGHDVERAFGKDSAQAAAVDYGTAGLLRQQCAHERQDRAKRDNAHAEGIGRRG